MLIADAIGIIVGIVLCKKIPERKIKLVSAGAFILFGLIGTWQVAAQQLFLELPMIVGILALLIALTGVAAYFIIKSDGHAEYGYETQKALVSTHCKIRVPEMNPEER